jgi:hypothetical protein
MMKKRVIMLIVATLFLTALVPGCAMYARHSARLNLSDMDDLLTAEKWIGLIPASKEIHAEGVGFLDQTIFYDATVTPSEVAWLDPKSEKSSFTAPGGSPLWWRLGIWWDAKAGDMKYFGSDSRGTARFAYSERKKVVYGYVELP